MKLVQPCPFLLRLLLLLAAAVRPVFLVGGWTPIKDLKDPHVVEIRKFAVSEHNKQSEDDMKFQSVVRGESQVVSGMNYRLLVATKDGNSTNNYEAIVWEKPWVHFMNLSSIKPVNA